MSFSHTMTTSTDGVLLHVVEGGVGRRVVLLHGFPEHWATWASQMGALVDNGCWVAAPDLRGYGGSGKPPGLHAYRMEQLVDDAEAVIRMHGHDRAHVVGHDWGGVIAWWLAMKRPALVDKLVIVNSPHPLAFLAHLKKNPLQALRSSYMAFFALPQAASILRAGNFALVRRMLASTAKKGAYSGADIDDAVAALAAPGALEGALAYYGAMVRSRGRLKGAAPVRGPIPHDTLVIWGNKDPVLPPALLVGLENRVARLRVEHLPQASHWVQHEAPGELSRLLVEHLAPASSGRTVS